MSAPDRALSSHLAGVAVQRGDAHQRRDAATVDLAQIGQPGQERCDAGRTDVRHAGQLGSELGTVALHVSCHVGIGVAKLRLEELHDPLDAQARGDVRMRMRWRW